MLHFMVNSRDWVTHALLWSILLLAWNINRCWFATMNEFDILSTACYDIALTSILGQIWPACSYVWHTILHLRVFLAGHVNIVLSTHLPWAQRTLRYALAQAVSSIYWRPFPISRFSFPRWTSYFHKVSFILKASCLALRAKLSTKWSCTCIVNNWHGGW